MTGPGDPLVALSGVTKRYGRTEALRGIDLRLGAGGIVGVVGPNGAGKTTLFSVLCGLLGADAGTVRLFGADVRPSQPPRPGSVGLLPQDAAMVPSLQVATHLRYYARLIGFDRAGARAEAERVLGLVRLEELAARKPGKLSHGQFKRVGIAAAFIGSPRLVLLDEPTAGLDAHAARDVRALLRAIAGETTVVVSSHNLTEIEDLCHEVVILREGRVVRHDTLSDLARAADEVVFRLTAPPSDALLTTLGAHAAVNSARWDPAAERLRVAIRTDGAPPEQAASAIAAALAGEGVAFVEMQVGKRLEDRFVEETR